MLTDQILIVIAIIFVATVLSAIRLWKEWRLVKSKVARAELASFNQRLIRL